MTNRKNKSNPSKSNYELFYLWLTVLSYRYWLNLEPNVNLIQLNHNVCRNIFFSQRDVQIFFFSKRCTNILYNVVKVKNIVNRTMVRETISGIWLTFGGMKWMLISLTAIISFFSDDLLLSKIRVTLVTLLTIYHAE